MYKKLETLTKTKLTKLQTLFSQVTFTDKNRRVGANGLAKMSIYTYSKWTSWTRIEKAAYKECFNVKFIDKAVVGWFLHFPKDTGFLDVMNYWLDEPVAGIIVAYALDDQEIIIDNEIVKVAAGEGIEFSLKQLHEIKPASKDQNWACLMTLVPSE